MTTEHETAAELAPLGDDAPNPSAPPANSQDIIDTPTFWNAFKNLLWKDYKQQTVRRPKSTCCRILLPVFFIAMLSLIRVEYDVTEYDEVIYDPIKEEFVSRQSGANWYNAEPRIPAVDSWAKEQLLCFEGQGEDEDGFETYPPPYYLSFVPDPTGTAAEAGMTDAAFAHYQDFIEIMGESWGYDDADDPESIDDWTDCGEVYKYLPFVEGWLVRYFANENELEDYVEDRDYGSTYNVSENVTANRPVGAAIIMNSISDDGLEWDYTFRFNTSQCADTNEKVDTFNRRYAALYWKTAELYAVTAFGPTQVWVEKSISYLIAQETGTNSSYQPTLATYYGGNMTAESYDFADYLSEDFRMITFPFPLASYETDAFWSDFSFLFFFFVLVQFVYPINVIVSVLVNEKAEKISEGLKMMGAGWSSYWASWILWFFIEEAIVSFLIAVTGKLGGVFFYSDVMVMFFYFWMMTLSLSAMSMLISTIFDNAKMASLFACMVWIVGLIAGGFGALLDEDSKGWFCLLAPACINMSLNNLSTYEQALLGIQFDNAGETYDDFKFSTAIVMFFVDYVLYTLLALYLDKVWPSRYGSKEPFYFLCVKSFWVKEEKDVSKVEIKKQFTEMDTATYEDTADKYDKMQPSIAIRQLRKHFEPLFKKSGVTVKAVNGVSLNMYEGEVFCLLGHNGAGKTTTIGMLTGLLGVTDGDAYILGSSVTQNMAECRKYMGVCPQHDVLFPLLTVREHLSMYARLKGCKPEHVETEVERTIDDVGLRERADFYPTQLSGGQKRKLSLGIAFVGQSKVVFLDEPTSGMDPQARRVTWELIAREKKNRTIILTTHYMDEADFLGDRIAIMAGGKVRCCGSSLFLKRLYGVGYTFTVSLKIGVHPKEIKPRLDQVVQSQVPQAKSIAVAGGEITYRLPFSQSEKFPDMFEAVDAAEASEGIGIGTYGVSVTTLEEVFLKIGHDDDPDESKAQLEPRSSVGAPAGDDDEEKGKSGGYSTVEMGRSNALTGDKYENPFPQPKFKLEIGHDGTGFDKILKEVEIFVTHCYAVMYRRFWWALRDARGWVCQLLIPGILAAMGLGVIQIFFTTTYPELELSVDAQNWKRPVSSYGVPISNIVGYDGEDPQPPFAQNDYLQTWEDYMVSDFGFLDPYDIQNASDGAEFSRVLLDGASDHKYIHYYAFQWIMQEDTFVMGTNISAYHGWPIMMNAFRNWLLKTEMDNGISLKMTTHPLPTTTTEDAFTDFILGLFAALYLLVAFAFVPVGAVYLVVLDKVTHTKHQQFVSGMSLFSYWVGNYMADIVNSLPAGLLVVIMVYIFDTESFQGDAAGPFILSIIAFIWAITPFTYLLSFMFSNPSGAQRWVAILYIILGIVLFIVTWILEPLIDNADSIGTMRDFFSIAPTYLLCDSVYAIALKDIVEPDKEYMGWGVCGKPLTYLLIEGFGYFALLLLVEWCSHQPVIMQALGLIPNVPKVDEPLDEDVAREQERIKKGVTFGVAGVGTLDQNQVPDSVVLAGLRKVYKSRERTNVAVKDIWYGVPQGQVFGFLGVNGAGKTSTMSVLTGELLASEGTGFIHGYPITEQNTIRRFIGYCPQFDALFELLTAEEHLKFYGRLKGLRGEELQSQIDMLLKVLSLTKYRHRRAGTYSGGNKRKLSVAISFIGNPPIVFLDEPSAGMDPVSRRHMWEFISKTMEGRAVILTTHSMEECEALCHRLAIMVAGQLRCIGTPQHIKSRFGHGYQLDVMLNDGEPGTRAEVEQALLRLFDVQCLEVNRHKATYELNEKAEWVRDHGKLTLAQLFRELESLKQNKPIQSYAVNQTSLEQIFLKMAKGEAVANPHHYDPQAASAGTAGTAGPAETAAATEAAIAGGEAVVTTTEVAVVAQVETVEGGADGGGAAVVAEEVVVAETVTVTTEAAETAETAAPAAYGTEQVE